MKLNIIFVETVLLSRLLPHVMSDFLGYHIFYMFVDLSDITD